MIPGTENQRSHLGQPWQCHQRAARPAGEIRGLCDRRYRRRCRYRDLLGSRGGGQLVVLIHGCPLGNAGGEVWMDSYEFVIVGGGRPGACWPRGFRRARRCRCSAGGGRRGVACRRGDPPARPTLLQSPANWGDVAPGQTAAGRPVAVARGRVLGGSSAINAMVFMRGHRSSYDRWVKEGACGWGSTTCSRSSAARRPPGDVIPCCAGWTAAIVGPATPPNPVLAACLDAAEEAGYRRADDISGGLEEGFGWSDLNIVAGRPAKCPGRVPEAGDAARQSPRGHRGARPSPAHGPAAMRRR